MINESDLQMSHCSDLELQLTDNDTVTTELCMEIRLIMKIDKFKFKLLWPGSRKYKNHVRDVIQLSRRFLSTLNTDECFIG